MKRLFYTAMPPLNESEAYPKTQLCTDDEFESFYARAREEAVGEITVEDVPNPPPTAQEKLESQVAYTAMMTGTMLPEEDEDV